MNEARPPAVVGERAFFSPAVQSLEEFNLLELLRKIWRHKSVVITTVITLMLAVILLLVQVTPQYSAEALLLLDARGRHIVNLEQVVGGLSIDEQTIGGEIEVIRSRGLAGKVIDQLKLDQDPELNSSLRSPGVMASLVGLVTSLPKSWFGAAKETPEEAALRRIEARVEMVDTFLGRLDVYRKGEGRVIAVEYTSASPATARLVANAVADLYLLEQLEAKFDATQRANVWLHERVASLQEAVAESESKVEEMRKDIGLVQGASSSLAAQEITELNSQLLQARNATAEAELLLSQVKDLVARPGGIDTAAQVLESTLIQRLREQEVELERQQSELSLKYSAQHPRMVSVRTELRDLRAKIDAEVGKIVQSIENKAKLARAREAVLEKQLDDMKVRVGELNTGEIQLRALEREAEANRTLLQTFLARFKETSAQEDIIAQPADARVISYADMPIDPSFPKTLPILGLTFFAAALLGCLLVFVIEQLDAGFRSGEQVERVTGVPALGLVPLLSAAARKRAPPETYLRDHPLSAFSESIRTLHTSILFSQIGKAPTKVLITSCHTGEGKTTTAACLAQVPALAGHKVVIVDADIRRPNVHRVFGMENRPGLVELLAGESLLKEVVQNDAASGVDVIPAGRPVPNPPDVLGSEQMSRLLDRLAQSYDLVVLDSPPVLAVSDARVLAKKVDVTVFVVRWAETRREFVSLGLKQIAAAGGRLAGVLLSMVDTKKLARYGYGDAGYYNKNVQQYFEG